MVCTAEGGDEGSMVQLPLQCTDHDEVVELGNFSQQRNERAHSAGLPPEVGGKWWVFGGASGLTLLGEERCLYHRTRTTCIVFSLCRQSTKTIVGCVNTISIMCQVYIHV